jgi:PAS domain S-box-containing protein
VKRNRPVSKTPRPRKRAPGPEATAPSNEAQQVEEDRLLAELETLREAQIEIEHSQQLYAELFDSAPVGYLNLTFEGRIQNANLAACALLERQRKQIVGDPFYIFVASGDMQKFTDHLRRCAAAEADVIATELRLHTKGNQERYVELLSRRSSLFGTTETIYRTVVQDTDRKS